jgi:type IV secretory pathway VirJ component
MGKVFFLLCVFLFIENTAYNISSTEIITNGSFGEIKIFRPSGMPNSVAFFLSDLNGWNKGADDMAGYVADLGAFVIGIDVHQYMIRLKKQASSCYYPASDFETLSILLQKKYKFHQYFKPILISYSSGSAIVYGTLAQAPANTFKGAIAFGFCPEMNMNKPLCNGSGLKYSTIKDGHSFFLEPSENLTAPFIVLHGINDRSCANDLSHFMKMLNMGQIIDLQNVGNGFPDSSSWHAQFKYAYKKVLSAPTFAELKSAQSKLLQSQHVVKLPGDLPVTLIPAVLKDTLPMVFFISGDGGWTSFDHAIAESLAEKGMPVVGLDAQKYFWNSKTPVETAADVAKAIQHYMVQWHKDKFILAGYSFGASVVPFIASQFAESMKNSLLGVYSLSPDETADFEIHITDMLDIGNSEETYNVVNEIKRIKHLHPVCLFGEGEDAESRKKFSGSGAMIITLPGSHHYNNNTALVAGIILKDIEKTIPQ